MEEVVSVSRPNIPWPTFMCEDSAETLPMVAALRRGYFESIVFTQILMPGLPWTQAAGA
jgi:hypothetical protein